MVLLSYVECAVNCALFPTIEEVAHCLLVCIFGESYTGFGRFGGWSALRYMMTAFCAAEQQDCICDALAKCLMPDQDPTQPDTPARQLADCCRQAANASMMGPVVNLQAFLDYMEENCY